MPTLGKLLWIRSKLNFLSINLNTCRFSFLSSSWFSLIYRNFSFVQMHLMVNKSLFYRRFQLLSRRQSPVKRSPRKIPRKSPRKSPRKKIRTPSSSAKKRLSQQLQNISHQSALIASASRASATKRALFQSPDKSLTSTLSRPLLPSTYIWNTWDNFEKIIVKLIISIALDNWTINSCCYYRKLIKI